VHINENETSKKSTSVRLTLKAIFVDTSVSGKAPPSPGGTTISRAKAGKHAVNDAMDKKKQLKCLLISAPFPSAVKRFENTHAWNVLQYITKKRSRGNFSRAGKIRPRHVDIHKLVLVNFTASNKEESLYP
jgi:hypothetical protein